MGALDSLQEGIHNAITESGEFIKENAVAIGVGTAGVAVGGALLLASGKKNKSKSKSKRGRSRDRKYISKEKWERAYTKKHGKGKRKYYHSKKSRRKLRKGKVYYARKTGQPYIILSSGKAKFIKGKRKRG
jgi:hypothetical protein